MILIFNYFCHYLKIAVPQYSAKFHVLFYMRRLRPISLHYLMTSTIEYYFATFANFCDTLLCVAYTLQNALEMGQEARIVQIDFSAAFYRVNHQGMVDP